MKKIISVILVALLLSFCFVLPAFATGSSSASDYVTFSENFEKLYYQGKQYSLIDGSLVDYNYDNNSLYGSEDPGIVYDYDVESLNSPKIDVKLTPEQQKSVEEASVTPYNNQQIFEVYIYFKNHMTTTATYLQDDYLDEYENLINGNIDEYSIRFLWPEGNTVKLSKEVFSSEETVESYWYEYDDSWPVCVRIDGLALEYTVGEIYLKDKEYYYLDYSINAYCIDNNCFDNETVRLVKITDPDAVAELDEGLQKYYNDDMGYIYNDDLLDSVSKVFLTVIFGIIPLVAFVVFIMLAIKSKKKIYKKIFITASALSIAEIISFIATAYMLFK